MSNEKKYKFSRERPIAVPVEDVDTLLSLSDETAALLYIYALKNGGDADPSAAAESLGKPLEAMVRAAELLVSGGLVAEERGPKLRPAPELPEYRADEIASGGLEDVISEVERIFGRMLSRTEMTSLHAIYGYLSLPTEVMLLLINHCVEEFRAQSMDGRLPSMRRIEKEAFVWSDKELLTLELAEEYIRRKAQRSEAMNVVRGALQISGRGLSSTEKKYVQAWLEMGFPPESIEIAYDRTVIKTGQLSWKYMNSIVESWHSKNLHTPEEIQAGDLLPSSGRKNVKNGVIYSSPSPVKGDMEKMKKLLERMGGE